MTYKITNSSNIPHAATGQWQRLLILVGLLVAFALRLFQLGAESLWYDETVSVALARQTIPDLIAHTARDIHPPAYYILLHSWQWLATPTLAHGLEFLYAWPSLSAGLLIVALLYPLARRFYQAKIALLALWLAAINPFHLWYSQEVRMYTWGGALGLLGLWALIRYITENLGRALDAEQPMPNGASRSGFGAKRWLFIYVLSGALGLYTLYYFLFVLVSLNLIGFSVFWRLRNTQLPQLRNVLRNWLGAQFLIGLLYAPWLPILWRQASDPPVPTWRTPWPTLTALAQSLSESLSALLIGQRPPDASLWPWALITVVVIATYVYTKRQVQVPASRHSLAPAERVALAFSDSLLLYTFVPILLIYLITLTVTPLYHVRYLFTYAPPFMIILAQALGSLRYRNRRRSQRWLRLGATAGIFLVSGWGLREFWFNPRYRTDDHRTAVAQLAAQWRPGDLILVNAGWVYTALTTYWPTELIGADGALPPPIRELDRLTTQSAAADQPVRNNHPVIIVRTGSIDGTPSLGWGEPDSDFYAIPAAESMAALTQISATATRIWHYRLYDTVSDPHGVIRAWLDAHADLLSDMPLAGRDYLRLQLYKPYTIQPVDPAATANLHEFGAALRLQNTFTQPDVAAGTVLYLQTHWLALPAIPKLPAALSLSLRLYDGNGRLAAQQDAGPVPPTNRWQPGQVYAIPLALPVPVATIPGDYELALVVYDAQSGAPLPTPGAQAASGGVTLGHVHVNVATQTPELLEKVASFDYIDLIAAHLASPQLTPAAPMDVRLIWRPRPNAYRDTYLAILALRNAQGALIQSWSAPLGGWNYPSGQWPAGIPVQEWRQITVEPNRPAGTYQVTLRVARSSDNQTVPARAEWWLPSKMEVVIGQITLESQ